MISRFLGSTAEESFISAHGAKGYEYEISLAERRSYCANSDSFSSQTQVFYLQPVPEDEHKSQIDFFGAII